MKQAIEFQKIKPTRDSNNDNQNTDSRADIIRMSRSSTSSTRIN
ncbi:hypothetical protein SLEP1_g60307 [Rubroshorea leprosula]|uniref:Uncharacterized protein n=1 Tax=Rubroshorea leprosula TaxID=152421 RepID=A0AAV5MWJ7_9ROSI|nr:hypothetical protein SLEP1_g60307 [Rubroshorea leprosula]